MQESFQAYPKVKILTINNFFLYQISITVETVYNDTGCNETGSNGCWLHPIGCNDIKLKVPAKLLHGVI